ncbi:hypothetical protein [Salinisphaera hydrothermalis]|uniref:hypothetical protein n=1 Tax=Salinisphaera hydrothermalis TaxID=563188 RepID=UPI0012EC17A9|nr:hypothetical protein [Salinisphaera hydrothermalis]
MNASSKNEDGTQNWERFRYIHGEVFRSIHSLLTHASNISRLFWPPIGRGKNGAKKEERGRILRERVGLPNENHPLKKRTLRDHLEHFDERIDSWRETSARKNYAQDLIGPQNMIQGLDPADMMRWYDPDRKRFMFRGEEFDMQELVSAINELLPTLNKAAEAAETELRGRKS